MSFKPKQITEIKEESQGNVERQEIDSEDLSKFSSEFGLIGKNIYIPKLIHSLDGETRVASTNEIKYKSSKDYPHIEGN